MLTRIIVVVLLSHFLSGCVALVKAFGHDVTDPEKTMVLMQLYSPEGASFDSATFQALTNGNRHSMLNSYRQDNGCMTMVSVFDAGSYELVSLFYNINNRGHIVYNFEEGDPDNVTFEVGPREVVYIGAYAVTKGETSETFGFGPTNHCGNAEDAISAYNAYAMDSYLFRGTFWPERFDDKLKSMGVTSQ